MDDKTRDISTAHLQDDSDAGQKRVGAIVKGARPGLRRLAAAIAAALAWGAYDHWQRYALASQTQAEVIEFHPTVRVETVHRMSDPLQLVLPGDVVAFEQARIFARVTGYVVQRYVDIGSHVHAGDLLARIAAPELDQQLAQTRATLAQRQAELAQVRAAVGQAQSNKDLADATYRRISTLVSQGWESAQNEDQTRLSAVAQGANVKSAEAAVDVAQANYKAQADTLRQIEELVGFEKVVAPFDGVITDRGVDTGDLTTGNASSGTSLFTLQRDDTVRVRVDVPQSAAVGLEDGLEAQITLPEMPDQVFRGMVARNARALNIASRTMSAEIDVHNDAHRLRPGQFVYVRFSIPRPDTGSLIVPANAILFNGKGLRVATVEASHRVKMHDISIYRDFGTTVELQGGLAGNERLIVNPPANLDEGEVVRIAGEKTN